MKIKWSLWARATPEPIPVISETEHYAIVLFSHYDGRYVRNKIKKEENLFDTFEQAKDFLIQKAKMRVRLAEAEWQEAKERLKKVNDMKTVHVNEEVLLEVAKKWEEK